MLFGPQRGSAFTIFDKFASTFGLPIAVVLLALIFRNIDALLQNGIVLAVVLITPVVRFLSYLFTYYSIDEEKFHVKSGLLNKKNLEIPLDRITTVDFTQNLIFQWAGVYSITVDNASNYGGNGQGKVQLALKKADAVRVKALLLSKKEEASQTRPVERWVSADPLGNVAGESGMMADVRLETYSESPIDDSGETTVVPARNILIMGALQSKGNAVAQVISILAVLGSMGNIILDRELGVEDRLVDAILGIPGIGIAAGILILFILLSTVLGAAFAFIKYYGFRIRNGEESIFIEYGLFTKKSYSLLKEKISGVEFVQSLPMRFFKVGYLNVLAVGYGDMESQEKAMMYPLIGAQAADEFVIGYIPEMKEAKEYERPLGGSLRYFFFCPRFFMMLVLVAAAVVAELLFDVTSLCPFDLSWAWILLALFGVLTVLSVVAEYGNTAVSAGKETVHFVSGGFTKFRTIIKTEKIESVSDRANALKRRRGIVSIKMGILAPAFDSVKQVRNMHLQAFENIKNVIEY
ncbi:MAG: PH domain-containing protein [Bacillota bacterium]|nr:PH domain-containing protein [Bacillota bacterium]